MQRMVKRKGPDGISATDAAFAARLLQALEQNEHCPDKNYGQLDWVRNQLSAKGIIVSNESVRKWLAAEARPKLANVTALADILKVDVAWLEFGADSKVSVKEQKARNAEASGSVNLVAGLVQMDGGSPAFPTEDDARAKADNVDLYAVIRGAQYAFHVTTGQMTADAGVFMVPAKHENVVVLGVVREGFSMLVYEITAEDIVQYADKKRGGSFTVTVPKGALKQITSFASRL